MREIKNNRDNYKTWKFIATLTAGAMLTLFATSYDSLFGNTNTSRSNQLKQSGFLTEVNQHSNQDNFRDNYSNLSIPEVLERIPQVDYVSGSITEGDNTSEKIPCTEFNNDCEYTCSNGFCTDGEIGNFCWEDDNCIEGTTCQGSGSLPGCRIPIGDYCQDDEQCKYSCVDDVCAPGKSCESNDECYDGLCVDDFCKNISGRCTVDEECLNGCEKLSCQNSVLGEYCEFDFNCKSEDLTCKDNKCTNKLNDGESCIDSDECLFGCEYTDENEKGTCTSGEFNSKCDSDTDCISDKCGYLNEDDLIQIGKICLRSTNEKCFTSNECEFACDNNFCSEGKEGDSCQSDKECDRGYCIDNVCDPNTSKREINDHCGNITHCQEGLICDDGICDIGELKLGEQCDKDSEEVKCREGLVCNKECMPILKEGEYCSTISVNVMNRFMKDGINGPGQPGYFLKKGVCEESTHCDLIANLNGGKGICTAYKEAETECSRNRECISKNCIPDESGKEYCSDTKASEGELCNDQTCQEGLVCDESETDMGEFVDICVVRNSKPIGDICIRNDACESGRCTNGGENHQYLHICGEKLEQYKTCESNRQCKSNYCAKMDEGSFCMGSDK
jgi:hypothetical protein